VFLEISIHITSHRRRWVANPGDILLQGVLWDFLPLACLSLVISTGHPLADASFALLAFAGSLHLWVIPKVRRQAWAFSADPVEIDTLMTALRRIDHWALVTISVAMGLLLSEMAQGQTFALAMLSPRVRTLRPYSRKSPTRTGVVDHYRVRTSHTPTHYHIEVRQPITWEFPREDTDLADLLMILLHFGQGADGQCYLNQVMTGQVFGLSRQMTSVRMALYRRRERIEDVLTRERQNHTTTPAVVTAIHQIVLEDPFVRPLAIRERLVADGIVARLEDISLPTVDRAIASVDYRTIRDRLEVMLRKGEVSPDHQTIARLFLDEMNRLATLAGQKISQTLHPIMVLIGSTSSGLPSSIDFQSSDLVTNEIVLPERPVSAGLRWSFLAYFSWGASYREAAAFLGVAPSTVFRRLRSLRRWLPSVQDVMGPLLYSGIVNIDEKYILVPKPKRDGKMGRWMYLFVAIDPYSYDLLHIEVYPQRNGECARAFLVGLKAKGVLRPKVIVTDLWKTYETALTEVFPDTVHHQCVFHAEQAASTLMRDRLGNEYRAIPMALALRDELVALFRSGSRRTLIRRYRKLLDRRPLYLEACADLAPVLDSLTRHFPKLAKARTPKSESASAAPWNWLGTPCRAYLSSTSSCLHHSWNSLLKLLQTRFVSSTWFLILENGLQQRKCQDHCPSPGKSTSLQSRAQRVVDQDNAGMGFRSRSWT